MILGEQMMTVDEALSTFYLKHGFQPGHRPWFVGVYVGCLLVPLPNIEARHRPIRQHDLHHVVTGYGVGRIGEGQVSAWELGTRSMVHPTIGFMNLIALSTGFALAPRKIYAAFVRGRQCRNLYSASARRLLAQGEFPTIEALRGYCTGLRPTPNAAFAVVELSLYVALAILIHVGLVVPALVTRTLTDAALGLNLIPKLSDRGVVQRAVSAARAP